MSEVDPQSEQIDWRLISPLRKALWNWLQQSFISLRLSLLRLRHPRLISSLRE